MITRLTHTTIFVLDQDQALDFYVDKLGFTKAMDFTTPAGFRWLTVSAPKQPDFQLSLLKVEVGDVFNEKTSALVRDLLAEGLGAGAFETDDCAQPSPNFPPRELSSFASPPISSTASTRPYKTRS